MKLLPPGSPATHPRQAPVSQSAVPKEGTGDRPPCPGNSGRGSAGHGGWDAADGAGVGSHPLKGVHGLRPPAAGGRTGLGDETAAQAQAEGRGQQDANVGCHETHRIGDVAQVQPGRGGGKRGRGGFGGATPPPPPPSPTLPGYPYLVTPMCRARTSQVLPAGKRGGAEFGRPRVGRLPAHPEQAASPWGEHSTSVGTQDGFCAQCSVHRAGTLAWHSTPPVLGTWLGPRRASAAPRHPDGWDPCTHVLQCWGSSPRALRGGGEAWESRGVGGRGQAALAPRTHSWAPAAGPGWAACIGIFGKRSGRGGRGCWSPEEL